MRKSLFLLAGLLVMMSAASPVAAAPEKGNFALGTNDVRSTPVGIRYWLSPKVGIDAEIGYQKIDKQSDNFLLRVGLPINVWNCTDVWVHFNPAYILDYTSYEAGPSPATSLKSTTDSQIRLMIEAEFFLLECLSFSVQHGLAIELVGKREYEDGTQVSDSATNLALAGQSLGYAGFHIYFK